MNPYVGTFELWMGLPIRERENVTHGSRPRAIQLYERKHVKDIRRAAFGYHEEETVARIHHDLRRELWLSGEMEKGSSPELRLVTAGPPVTAADYELIAAELRRREQKEIPPG